MIHSNKRKLNLLFFLIACIFVSVAATKPSVSSNEKVSVNDTGLFKNLKVLPKDITKERLDTIMHKFNAALGVRCNFCHVFSNGKPDFPNDEKSEKNIARYMMTMTAEINTKYFNPENSTRPDTISFVRCVTCHNGRPHPGDTTAVNNQNNMQPPPPGQQPSQPGQQPPQPGQQSPPPPHDSTGKTPPKNQ